MKKTKDEQMTLGDTEENEIRARLSDRVEKAVSLIQDLRRERDQLKTRVTELESRVGEHENASTRLESLEEEHERFRKERDEIRDRIETILSSLEVLES